ncbi:hypothetical protein IAQ61_000035, partial [Plenodomus lingam]
SVLLKRDDRFAPNAGFGLKGKRGRTVGLLVCRARQGGMGWWFGLGVGVDRCHAFSPTQAILATEPYAYSLTQDTDAGQDFDDDPLGFVQYAEGEGLGVDDRCGVGGGGRLLGQRK